jgi:hypothetical protein
VIEHIAHQCELVDTLLFFKIAYYIAIPVIWRDKTWRAWSVEIEGDSPEWCDISIADGGPNTDFPEEPLKKDKIYQVLYCRVLRQNHTMRLPRSSGPLSTFTAYTDVNQSFRKWKTTTVRKTGLHHCLDASRIFLSPFPHPYIGAPTIVKVIWIRFDDLTR